MQLTVNMEHAEDLAALAILAQALNVARYSKGVTEDAAQHRIDECVKGAICADKLYKRLRDRQKYFESTE